MPIEDSVPALRRTLCVVFQHCGANSLTSIRLRPDAPLDEMTNLLLGEYNDDSSTPLCPPYRPVFRIATPGEPVNLDSRPAQDPQAAMTGQDPSSSSEAPLRSNNNYFTSEAGSSAAARQPSADAERAFEEAFPIPSKLTRTRLALLTAGALFMIVVPGLVLGLTTRQVQWSIALSGAIATVVSLFAGLCYYQNK